MSAGADAGRIFEVDHPLVLADDLSQIPIWDRLAPAPVLLAAVAGPERTVLEVGATDGLLVLLAGILGSEAASTSVADVVVRSAQANGLRLHVVDDARSVSSVDVLIIHEASAVSAAPAADIILATFPVDIPGRRRVGILQDAVLLDDPRCWDIPQLHVMAEKATQVSAAVSATVQAFSDRDVNPWADRAVASALRLSEQAQAAARESMESSQEQVRRAYDQMVAARDELRAVRASRSWRYTGVIRRWSRT